MITLDTRHPDFENPMTFGDYYTSPDETLTCPTCGKTWERWGDEWETVGETTSDKRPVVGRVCRACMWEKGQDSEKSLIAFMRANAMEKDVLKYALLKADGGDRNQWLWKELADLAAEAMPEMMASATLDVIHERQLIPEYIDYLMGV